MRDSTRMRKKVTEKKVEQKLFEKFAKMAKEQFGCTVIQAEPTGETFETLFGIDLSGSFEF